MVLNSGITVEMLLPQGRGWLHPSCWDKKTLVTTCAASTSISPRNSAEQTSSFRSGDKAEQTWFLVELLNLRWVPHFSCLRLYVTTKIFQNEKYLCTGYTSSWHVSTLSVIAYFCNFLHVLYSHAIQISKDIYKLLLPLKKMSHMHFSIAMFLSRRLHSVNNSPTVGFLPV